MVDKFVCFVKVLMKGWVYLVENLEEVVEIVLENDVIGVQIEKYQICMVGEINKLVDGFDGKLDMGVYEWMVKLLLVGGFDLVIIKELEGVIFMVVIDKF